MTQASPTLAENLTLAEDLLETVGDWMHLFLETGNPRQSVMLIERAELIRRKPVEEAQDVLLALGARQVNAWLARAFPQQTALDPQLPMPAQCRATTIRARDTASPAGCG